MLPILGRDSKDKPIYDEIPLKHQFYNSWIIQIGNEQPKRINQRKYTLLYAKWMSQFATIIRPIGPTLIHVLA